MWPFLVRTDGFYLPTYIVINSLVFSLGIIWIYKRALKQGFNVNNVLDMAMYAMLGIFVGSRLVHVLVERPDYYMSHPWDVFKVWQGGFVYYGGLIGGTLTAYIVSRMKGMNLRRHLDLAAPVLALGYSIGRWGCFLAGCCYGRACDLPWAVKFPPGVEAAPFVPRHPTQIYSSLWEAGVFAVLILGERTGRLKGPGRLFGAWLLLHAIGRGIIEQFRDDFRGPAIFNLSISTWISLALAATGIWLLVTSKGRKNVSTST